jgi:hypothetical protein
MISVTEWGEYIERLAGASGRIKSCLVVADIAHLKEKLKETDSIEYPLLVGVIPSAYSSTTNDEDNVSELNVCLLFVLSPILRDYDSDTELNNYRDTHEALVDIKRTIRQDYFNCEQYPLLREIKFKSYVQEPEWNMLDLMGWSLGFEVETGEYSSTEPMPPMPPQPPVPPTYSGLRYEYTNEGLVIYQDVKNNYEEDGTFILLIQVGTNDPIMLRAWINTRETYTFATKALNLDNAQTYEVIAFDYTMQETARITLPAYDIFTYGTLTSVYADDADYNDVIRCSLTVTNNTSIAQNCIVYLKHNDHFVQLEEVVTENTAYTFTYDFADVDIFVENIVTFHDSAMNQLSSVTIVATPPFEMFFEASLGNMIVQITLSANDFCDIFYGDGTSDNIITAGNYNQYSSLYSHEYTTVGLKKITFTDARRLQTFYIHYLNTKTYSSYYISDISQLRNLHFFAIYLGSGGRGFNVSFTASAFAKATKNVDVLYLSTKGYINDLCFQRKIYTYIILRYVYNFNVSADKLSEIMYYTRSFRIYAASIDETTNKTINVNSLIKTPYINSFLYLSYCNCPNISKNSDFGDGYNYLFTSSNLSSEAVDNAIFVLVNTNNYIGAAVKTLNLSENERRTHASDADLATLLSRGWVVTVSEPL